MSISNESKKVITDRIKSISDLLRKLGGELEILQKKKIEVQGFIDKLQAEKDKLLQEKQSLIIDAG
jgi:hypothetical protein